MPDSKRISKHDGKPIHIRTRAEVIAEAVRLGHDIGVKARAIESSQHPILALEQLQADLDFACHLARDVQRLISEQA
ncbi:MAG TPA: hypothetical protein VHF22_11855 [Planctomycetota bacterium]|nr:hypothetical protein [Planctomycetota bacterium]